MKKNLTFVLIFSFFSTQAQHFVGFKSGVNFSNTTKEFTHLQEYTINKSFKTGFLGGVTYEYTFKTNFLLGVDVLYHQLGYTVSPASVRHVSPLLTPIDKTEYFNYNYLSFPVKVGYRIGSKVYGVATLGVCSRVLLNANYDDFYYNSYSTIEERNSEINNTSSFCIAALGEIGAGYFISEKFDIFVIAGFQYDLTTYSGKSFYSNTYSFSTNNNERFYTITLLAGIKYKL